MSDPCLSDAPSPPLIVVGMHRSGTSFAASVLAALGVSMGRELLQADPRNRRGYFEDQAFLDLNRRMLAAACPQDEAGHPDWGWTEHALPDPQALEAFREEALELLASSRPSSRLWGWKDPRTTLLLEFWHSLLPDARYLMVYRPPWDVADSIQRLGWSLMAERPHYAELIWQAYNTAMLAFFRRHRDRCLLVSTPRLSAEPAYLAHLLQSRWGFSVASEGGTLFDPELFKARGRDDPLAALHGLAWPESARLLNELESLADLPSEPHEPQEAQSVFCAPGGDCERSSSVGAVGAAAGTARTKRFRPRLIAVPGQTPRFSVITPVCDDGVYLPESIASAERSCPDDTELILIDDGSTDPFTLSLLERLRHCGYLVIRQDNQGLSCARNRAIEQARGQYLLALDADNRIRPGLLQQAAQILDQDPAVGVVYPDLEKFCMRQETIALPDFDLPTMLKHNYIDACAVFRKQVWAQVGGYDTTLPALEDWDFWLRASQAGWKFHHLREPLLEYRVRPGSMMSWVGQDDHMAMLQARVLARHRAPSGMIEPTARGSWPMLEPLRAGLASLGRRLGLRRQQNTREAAAVPDFLILGAMKAGTTSLHACLVSHSGVLASVTKEVHYFDLHYDRGHRWYREQLRIDARAGLPLLCGESSPYYLYHPAVPGRVARDCPQARLVVLLRDPVARAISHYHHARRLGFETLPLEDALAQETHRLGGQAQALESGALRVSVPHQHLSYKSRGQYAEQLERWLQHLSPDQMLIVQSERLFEAPDTELARVCHFLGLKGRPLRPLKDLNSGDYPAAAPQTIEALKRHFDPWNDRLDALLRSRWGVSIDRTRWA